MTRTLPAQHASAGLLTIPAGLTAYSIGDPTDEEQLYLEKINKARSDPVAESNRLQSIDDPEVLVNLTGYAVDFELMSSQFADLSPVPPLSMNAQLSAAARRHSQDMLANSFQDHTGSDGSTPMSRVQDQGYPWSAFGENVFAAAHSVEHGHAAFEVDWGVAGAVGGMQNPPGHRLNIHSGAYREVGIGLALGVNGGSGPQVVTQDFGSRQGLTPFVTGVVYYDLNGNGAYDLGEGVGGVVVQAAGSSYYAVTAGSGGYSLPVPPIGMYGVTFSAVNMIDRVTTVAVANDTVKVDQVLSYTPPPLTGPDQPLVNQPNTYTCTIVSAATRYVWMVQRLAPPSFIEGAESGLGQFTAITTPSYAVVDSSTRASGQNSFHLAHPRSGGPDASPEDQYLVLGGTYLARSDSALTFASRLGWAGQAQVARAQVRLDGGTSWQDLWSQAGTDSAGESGFTMRTIPLGAMANRAIQIRFMYDVTDGGFYPQTETGVGFYLDDVRLMNTDALAEAATSETIVNSLDFIPADTARYALSVRPIAGARQLPAGPVKIVSAQAGSGTTVRLTSLRFVSAGTAEIRFVVTNPGAARFQIESGAALSGPWSLEDGAAIQGQGGSEFVAALPVKAGSQRFYRVRATP